LVLREVIGLDIVPQPVFALRQWLDSSQQLDQRGFTRAVHANQSMTRNHNGDRIECISHAHGTVGGGLSQSLRELAIRKDSPQRNGSQRRPHLLLEGSPTGVDRNTIYAAEVARQIGVHPAAEAKRVSCLAQTDPPVAGVQQLYHSLLITGVVKGAQTLTVRDNENSPDR